MKTAVEWFANRLIERGLDYSIEDFEEAKKMENQKLKEMYLKGIENYDPTFTRKS